MIRETEAKSILRKYNRIDSWFLGAMGMNLYRGCVHNCAYCDGRSEKYQVTGEFGRDIEVKVNAPALLNRELDPTRKRTPFPGGYMFLGGGVNDAYQPAETTYGLARKALELIYRYYHPVHILTKSTLVEEDIDLIEAIHRRRGAIVSMSFSSVNPEICKVFEPGVPAPEKRLETLRKFRERGIPCGMYLMPVIPFITDTAEEIGSSVAAAKKSGFDFLVFGTMTMKSGRQRDHFMRVLKEYAPEKCGLYDMIYPPNPYGGATPEYTKSAALAFNTAADFFHIPKRIPLRLFENLVNMDERILVILDQIGGLTELQGERNTFGYAAYQLSQKVDKSGNSIKTMGSEIKKVKGVGPKVLHTVLEIINTGTSGYYESMMCR
ncbi:MAG: radical SAM protein [Spirochaetales bacterium]|nr:radical SAM protein [Spirochaetales bacterium]